MAAHLPAISRVTALAILIAIVAATDGCKRPSSEPAVHANDVNQTLVGKPITLRGTFSLNGVQGPFVLLANQQTVYLKPSGSFAWGKPFSEMQDKLVEATGTLKFFHAPDATGASDSVARAPDHYYFQAETVELREIRE